METKLQTITPKMAATWLDKRNDGNRNIRRHRVAALSRAIAGGRWVPTHQGIAFDEKGNLIDGQHRLSAIVEANQPVELMVTRGLTRESMTVIDRGAVRDPADTLRILRGTEHAKRKVPAARIVMMADQSAESIDDAALDEHIQAYGGHYDWMFALDGFNRIVYAPLAGALVYAYPTRPDKVIAFAKGLIEPSGLTGNSPILLVYEMLNRRHAKPSGGSANAYRASFFRKALRGIQLHCDGKTAVKLQDGQYGLDYFRRLRAEMGL